MMDKAKKRGRYQRLRTQIEGILQKCEDKQARMATISAVLYHKMDYFFWCGFYMLQDGRLIVNNYQGPVACQELAKDTGVCWAGINQGKTLVIEDVEKFPGHIACDSRSKSEVVVPVKDETGNIIGILDVDSRDLNSFDEVDAEELEKIIELINTVEKI